MRLGPWSPGSRSLEKDNGNPFYYFKVTCVQSSVPTMQSHRGCVALQAQKVWALRLVLVSHLHSLAGSPVYSFPLCVDLGVGLSAGLGRRQDPAPRTAACSPLHWAVPGLTQVP